LRLAILRLTHIGEAQQAFGFGLPARRGKRLEINLR
jgi:hypothetical protein